MLLFAQLSNCFPAGCAARICQWWTDKLAAAIQKPAAKQQSAQSVMAAQSNGKGTGGRGAGMATMVRQTEAEVAAGAEAGVPSPVQQLLLGICDTRPSMVQMN